MDRSDLATIGIPSPQEKRRAVLVASVHQNSTWWNRFTWNRSDFGLVRTKFLKPTSLNPVWVWAASVWVWVSLPMGNGGVSFSGTELAVEVLAGAAVSFVFVGVVLLFLCKSMEGKVTRGGM